MKADSPDAIYASGYFFTAGPLVRQIRDAGIEVPVIGQEGYDSEKFIEIAGPAAEGVINHHLARSRLGQSGHAGVHRRLRGEGGLSRRHGRGFRPHRRPGHGGRAEEGGNRRPRPPLRDAIAMAGVDASTGFISFNALGEVKKDVQVQVVKDGAWRRYAVMTDPVLLAPPEK